MYKEAGQIATVYGVNIALILKKREKYQQEVTDAQAELNACDMNDAVARRKAFKRRNTAKAALHWYEERSRQEMRNMIHLVRSGPNGSRRTPTTGWRLSTRSPARGARVPEASCSTPFRRNSSNDRGADGRPSGHRCDS